jgi:uncharacterized protein (TIGR03118 family)
MRDGLKRSRIAIAIGALLVVIFTASALAAGTRTSAENAYVVHNLVSDVPGAADQVDPKLVNAWGLTSTSGSPWWVADNGTDASTLYQADGTKVPLDVDVHNAPTGVVGNPNPGTNFIVHENGHSGSSRFIFDTEEGKILGWSPAVALDHAVVAVDRSDVHAIYKGLALGTIGTADFLYAADFSNARVDVFDEGFNLVTTPGSFVDPKLQRGYAPFGIANIDGQIFVSYAKQDAQQEDEIAGQGLGFVDRYSTGGAFLGRVATHGQLNAPWGLAHAPASFGAFGGDLLVGNFGDGEINAYQPQGDGSYERVGALRNDNHKPILIDGLWALSFGKGAIPANGPIDTLFFTAGPDDENHGLFGSIRAR